MITFLIVLHVLSELLMLMNGTAQNVELAYL